MRFHTKLALVPLLALLAFPAWALDCDNHQFTALVDTYAPLDEPIESYDACWESRVIGTVNGRNVNCGFIHELCGPYGCYGRTSEEIWGDGWIEYGAWKLYGLWETDRGSFKTIEWGWFDGVSGMESSVARIVDGTGDFEGASGFLSGGITYPNTNKYTLRGQICTE